MSGAMIDRLLERNHGLFEMVAELQETIKGIERVALARAERIAELEAHLDRARAEVVRLQDEKEASRG